MTISKLQCKGFNSIYFFRNSNLEKKLFLFGIIFVIVIYLGYTLITVPAEETDIFENGVVSHVPHQNQKYLINTSKCRIPDIDPFNEEVIKYVFKEKYEKCTNLQLLTYIDKSNGEVSLRVNTSLLPLYSSFQIKCCYSKISRINYFNKSDNEITFSPCISFKEKVVLSHPFIRVICSTPFQDIYTNVHATTIPTANQRAAAKRGGRFSVLLVGIDSISKLNLRRTMPKTYDYLEKHFVNLKGYNKVYDNTFPNLMAILTGQNKGQLEVTCSTKVKLNNCDMIWDTFREMGYVTAYAEDECNIGTFNYDRPGFSDPPTDYYYRPYMLASEKLPKKYRYGMTFCAGPETSGERIFNIAKDFSVSFTNVPSFGLFWMNSYSHDNINIPSAMDEKVLELLSDTSFRSSLDNTIMLLFSDHGFRFGDIRYTHTGWLEERLPFIYVHIPHNFKKSFPSRYKNFLINTQRLTSPYDIYNTFQDLLAIANQTYKPNKSRGCLKCHSLFEEVDESRTCKLAAIDQHWCTCTGHNYINPKGKLVKLVAEFVVKEINIFIKSFTEGSYCANYKLKKVVTAGMSEPYSNDNNEIVNYFLVIIETNPNAMFEATVEAFLETDRTYFKLLGDISRINRYAAKSFCVKSAMLKKYCYCDGFLEKITSAICSFFNC